MTLSGKCVDNCSLNSKKKKALSLLGNMEKNNTRESQNLFSPLPFDGAQSTCCQPGFTQRLPTPAYGKHTLTYTHTQACTYPATISGSVVLESGRRLIMSECHIFMHESAVFTHTDMVTLADLQIYRHKDTQTHTELHVHTH